MQNTERLAQLIVDAKAHRAAQQQRVLDDFRQALEQTATPELAGILEMAYELDRDGRNPTASFTVGPWRCAVTRSTEPEPSAWRLEMRQATGATSGRSFDSQDELLLILDELLSKQ
jgi:hypothetical protein